MKKEFVNYYEVLEASPKANSETIERIFRHLAKLMHPDHADGCDMERFTRLVEAYEVLKDPVARAEYDKQFALHVKQNEELIEDTQCADEDSEDRHKLLSLFYAKRRKNMRQPGIGITTIEELMGCTPEVLEFHMWYFRNKGWIAREENGMLAITAEGVDRIESMVQQKAERAARRRITVAGDNVEYQSSY